jgi:hypothetical protein
MCGHVLEQVATRPISSLIVDTAGVTNNVRHVCDLLELIQ